MRNSTRLVSVALMMMLVLIRLAAAEDVDPAVKKLVEEVVATAGGEEKLLKLFRFRERVLITSTPARSGHPSRRRRLSDRRADQPPP